MGSLSRRCTTAALSHAGPPMSASRRSASPTRPIAIAPSLAGPTRHYRKWGCSREAAEVSLRHRAAVPSIAGRFLPSRPSYPGLPQLFYRRTAAPSRAGPPSPPCHCSDTRGVAVAAAEPRYGGGRGRCQISGTLHKKVDKSGLKSGHQKVK